MWCGFGSRRFHTYLFLSSVRAGDLMNVVVIVAPWRGENPEDCCCYGGCKIWRSRKHIYTLYSIHIQYIYITYICTVYVCFFCHNIKLSHPVQLRLLVVDCETTLGSESCATSCQQTTTGSESCATSCLRTTLGSESWATSCQQTTTVPESCATSCLQTTTGSDSCATSCLRTTTVPESCATSCL